MAVHTGFRNVITSVEELRELVGFPHARARDKEISFLDAHCRQYIAQSPFVLIATASAAGECTVSPKGDAPGFVKVLDDHTLVIPDRPGNRRMDGLRNIVENPSVGLLFLVPNVQYTLRVNGRATIVRDEELLEQFEIQGKRPLLAIAVEMKTAFTHCPKCAIRSSIWELARAGEPPDVPSFAQVLHDHAALPDVSPEEIARQVEEGIRTGLY
jgi:PPOX class probable FMN-dependent enzyme